MIDYLFDYIMKTIEMIYCYKIHNLITVF